MIAWMLIATTFWIGIPVAIFIFARRLLRAVERRSVTQSELAGIVDRLGQLEQRIEDIASDQDKLSEGQRFTQSVLTGRSQVDQRE